MRPTNRSALLFAFVLLGLAALVSGCSSFGRDWKRAAAQRPPDDDITGAWDGQWISDVNGHNGRLRALVTKQAPGKYKARFHAKYRRILSFGYEVPLAVQQLDGNYQLAGETTLPWWAGGRYEYEGHATSTNFFSKYNSKHDHGTFEMKRP